jgi:AcrR family transcriptional regulator
MTGEHAGADRPPLRADARRSLEKLKATAIRVFSERGLDTPLEVVAQQAGVSIGTLYNRFGSREGLIDAVAADLAAARLRGAVQRARSRTDRWERFATFVELICELQSTDPGFNDVVSRRYPEAIQLKAVCDEALEHATEFIRDAQRHGSLRPDFTAQDLFTVLLANASLVRATPGVAPGAWRRNLAFLLDGLRLGPGQASAGDR